MKDLISDIIPLSSGGSYKLLWDMLYHIRLLKYVRHPHIRSINPRYSKICAVKKLDKLVEIGWLENPSSDVYIATDNVLPILKDNGYLTKTLPKAVGYGGENELHNTSVFIQALKLPDFKALLYPSFDYIRPDALLVRGDNVRYKLEFLEVEYNKPDWISYLENKRVNYLKLAQDRQVFAYWKSVCSYLNLPVPDESAFKFSVSVIGKICLDFGNGFNFRESL